LITTIATTIKFNLTASFQGNLEKLVLICQIILNFAAAARDNEKALRQTQTLRAGCSKAEPKIVAPLQTPFPGARDGQNLISWRWSLPLPTDPVW